MNTTNYKSRLKKIEERKNTHLAVMFILLSIGFVILIIFVGIPLFVKGAVWFGDMKSAKAGVDKNDIIPPVPPTLIYTNEATKSSILELPGYSEPSSIVTIYKNDGKIVETVTDEEGNFKFSNFKLNKGSNNIFVKSKDTAGNESQPSKTITISYDDEAPMIKLMSPEDGAKFFDVDKEILVAGETDVDANVRVNGNVATVDTKGNFVKKINLYEGDNEIKIEAFDLAGNKTEKIIKVNYQK